MRIEIIYEDSDILVLYKPAGLATQSAHIGEADVVSECKNYIRAPYLGIVHRLDQPVEGLLVFAKNPKAAAALTRQLSTNVLNKHYYAILCGQMAESEGDLVDSLRKNGNVAQVVTGQEGQYPDAKKAVLHYRVLQTIHQDHQDYTLADIEIETGRFHQIRAQFSHAGCPLFGDRKYGGESGKDDSTGDSSGTWKPTGLALCAYQISFRHPVSGKVMEFHIVPRNSAFAHFS